MHVAFAYLLHLLPCFAHGSEVWLQIQGAHTIRHSNRWWE